VADLLRGPYQPSEYRHVFIPMTVLRRLDCVLAPHKDRVRVVHDEHLAAHKGKGNADLQAERDTLDDCSDLPFFNVSTLDLAACRRGNVKDNLLKYLRAFYSNVRGLFDQFNLKAHIERIAAADASLALLDRVVATFVAVDLCLAVDGDRVRQGAVRTKVYDPACGTGGMLTVADTRIRALNPKARPMLYGQEWQPET